MYIEKALSKAEATGIGNNKNVGSIDFSKYSAYKPDAKTWQLLNNEVFSKRPDINLRLFDCTDISFLQFLPDVTMIQWEANDLSNYEPLLQLKNLKLLKITNKSKTAITLEWLEKYAVSLHTLSVTGKFDALESSIAKLVNLKQLHLGAQNCKHLNFISGLQQLKKINLAHTKVKDVSAINTLQLLEFNTIGSELKDPPLAQVFPPKIINSNEMLVGSHVSS